MLSCYVSVYSLTRHALAVAIHHTGPYGRATWSQQNSHGIPFSDEIHRSELGHIDAGDYRPRIRARGAPLNHCGTGESCHTGSIYSLTRLALAEIAVAIHTNSDGWILQMDLADGFCRWMYRWMQMHPSNVCTRWLSRSMLSSPSPPRHGSGAVGTEVEVQGPIGCEGKPLSGLPPQPKGVPKPAGRRVCACACRCLHVLAICWL